MTEKQTFKHELLKQLGFDISKAKEAYNFIMEESDNTLEGAIVNTDTSDVSDGVYLQYADGFCVRFTGENPESEVDNCIGIAIKCGSRSICVALSDEAAGEEITLTCRKDKTKYDRYITECIDAVADWNGKENTEHLKEIGLNSEIHLEGGWWIPSVAELYLIFTNLKTINEALEYVGGTPIEQDWYWSSTENSATNAWILHFSYGYLNYGGTKATGSGHVRAVSASTL